MNLRNARKIWFGEWHRYRHDVRERAIVRFLRWRRLSYRQCAHDLRGTEWGVREWPTVEAAR